MAEALTDDDRSNKSSINIVSSLLRTTKEHPQICVVVRYIYYREMLWFPRSAPNTFKDKGSPS
jgi:hypothetical protein